MTVLIIDIIHDFLRSLGLGEQMVVAVILIFVVLYLFRARSITGKAAGVMGTLWLVGVAIGVGAALMIAFGWVDPNPTKFLTDLHAFAGAMYRWAVEPIIDSLMARF